MDRFQLDPAEPRAVDSHPAVSPLGRTGVSFTTPGSLSTAVAVERSTIQRRHAWDRCHFCRDEGHVVAEYTSLSTYSLCGGEAHLYHACPNMGVFFES